MIKTLMDLILLMGLNVVMLKNLKNNIIYL